MFAAASHSRASHTDHPKDSSANRIVRGWGKLSVKTSKRLYCIYMAVSKAQHNAHTSTIQKIAKFFGPRKTSAMSPPKFSSTIPGVGTLIPRTKTSEPATPFVSSLPKNQKTFGVPGAQ